MEETSKECYEGSQTEQVYNADWDQIRVNRLAEQFCTPPTTSVKPERYALTPTRCDPPFGLNGVQDQADKLVDEIKKVYAQPSEHTTCQLFNVIKDRLAQTIAQAELQTCDLPDESSSSPRMDDQQQCEKSHRLPRGISVEVDDDEDSKGAARTQSECTVEAIQKSGIQVLSQDVSTWNVDHVVAWVATISHLEGSLATEIGAILKEQSVSGPVLLELDDKQAQDLGVSRFPVRKALLVAVEKLRETYNAMYGNRQVASTMANSYHEQADFLSCTIPSAASAQKSYMTPTYTYRHIIETDSFMSPVQLRDVAFRTHLYTPRQYTPRMLSNQTTPRALPTPFLTPNMTYRDCPKSPVPDMSCVNRSAVGYRRHSTFNPVGKTTPVCNQLASTVSAAPLMHSRSSVQFPPTIGMNTTRQTIRVPPIGFKMHQFELPKTSQFPVVQNRDDMSSIGYWTPQPPPAWHHAPEKDFRT